MNCEKCKNKKATVFYADDDGGRHALCAACGALRDKLGKIATQEQDDIAPAYVPTSTLSTLCTFPTHSPIYIPDSTPSLLCPVCRLTPEELKNSGAVGCPQCYEVFGEVLFPLMEKITPCAEARMPLSRRRRIEKKAAIAELRRQIKDAVENENYELAATLRDKIKKLEAGTV